MSAVITDFRAYQSAVKHAARAGVPREVAVHRVAEARAQGASGNHVAGQFQHAANRLPMNRTVTHYSPDGPEAA